jgi:vitamin B12 transporter
LFSGFIATSGTAVQGSNPEDVRVLVDGVTINSISESLPDVSAIPVQQIERIEIIKGAASSAWGSSLGGVINIITKSPDPDRQCGGMTSASIGELTTGDLRAEVSGTLGRFGYYINGSGLKSDGLTPNDQVDAGNLYSKFNWNFPDHARLQLSLAYNKGSRGDGQDPVDDLSLKDRYEYFFSTISYSHNVTDALSFDIGGRVSTKRNIELESLFTGGEELLKDVSDELSAGGSAKLNWRKGMHNLLAGTEYDNGAVDSSDVRDGRQSQVRWALFANDTISLKDFSITPGVRYDHTSTNGPFWSPSLGLTFNPADKLIFRGYVARGFNTPPLSNTYAADVKDPSGNLIVTGNPNLKSEEVWSYSVGVETASLKYFWFKVTGFLYDIRNVIEFSPTEATFLNSGKQRRQGVEAEMRTLSVWNTSLLTGYSFIDIKDRVTGEVIPNLPRNSWDVGVDYNDNDAWRGALRGHWIWWNASADASARYTAMIWDLHLTRKIIEKGDTSAEAFFSIRNIFSGSQYLYGLFPNTGRWFEGGVRIKF